jgi:hypothetical protein
MDPIAPNVTYGQVRRPPGRLAINLNYVSSVPGVVRVLLVLSSIGGGITALIAPNVTTMPSQNQMALQSFIYISFISGFISITLLSLQFFNIVHVKFFDRLPWITIVTKNSSSKNSIPR